MKTPSSLKIAGVEGIVAEKRQNLGLSQKALAARVGTVSQSQISMLESGRLDVISEDNLMSVLRALDIDPGSLAEGLQPPTMVPAACFNPNCHGRAVESLGAELLIYPLFLNLVMEGGASADEVPCPCCGTILQTKCTQRDCAHPVIPKMRHCTACGHLHLGKTAKEPPVGIARDYRSILERPSLDGRTAIECVEELVVRYESRRRKILMDIPGLTSAQEEVPSEGSHLLFAYRPPAITSAKNAVGANKPSLKLVG